MRTTLTRLLAGTAVAATAVLTVAGTASATTPPPKAPTNLSITVAKGIIIAGQKDTVSGRLSSAGIPVPHRIIQLDRWSVTKKKWYAFEEKKTGVDGRVAFVVVPKTTTTYRLAFLGGPNFKFTHSAPAKVTVKPFVKTPTMLSISQTPNASKHTDTISGQLATSKGTDLRGQFVWLARVVDGKAHLMRALKTNKLGDVSFVVKPTVTTTYELKFIGTKVLAGSTSGTVTDTVS
jgi:5-hydroxyisourate hydrolase-like protein (transthyretin family)